MAIYNMYISETKYLILIFSDNIPSCHIKETKRSFVFVFCLKVRHLIPKVAAIRFASTILGWRSAICWREIRMSNSKRSSFPAVKAARTHWARALCVSNLPLNLLNIPQVAEMRSHLNFEIIDRHEIKINTFRWIWSHKTFLTLT